MAVRRRAGTDTGGGTPTVYRAQCPCSLPTGRSRRNWECRTCVWPIQYAFSYPLRLQSSFERLDLFRVGTLTFEEPDTRRFRNLALAYEALHEGGNMPCIVNAANEIVNRAFLEDRIGFLQMSDVIANTMRKTSFVKEPTYEDYLQTDAEAQPDCSGVRRGMLNKNKTNTILHGCNID